jgi:hypothetical protein
MAACSLLMAACPVLTASLPERVPPLHRLSPHDCMQSPDCSLSACVPQTAHALSHGCMPRSDCIFVKMSAPHCSCCLAWLHADVSRLLRPQVVPHRAPARLLAEQGLMRLLLEIATWVLDPAGGGAQFACFSHLHPTLSMLDRFPPWVFFRQKKLLHSNACMRCACRARQICGGYCSSW